MPAPDGRNVYYALNNQPGLWSVPIDGGQEVKVLDRVSHSYWTVRHQGVYFFDFTDSSVEGPFPVLYWNPQTLKITRLTEVAGLVQRFTPGMDVSPDGRILSWSRFDQVGSDLMMIENFR